MIGLHIAAHLFLEQSSHKRLHEFFLSNFIVSIALLLLFIFIVGASTAELDSDATWESSLDDESYCVAWGDFDNDGDLDLASGNNGPNHLYENVEGELLPDPVWESTDDDETTVTHEVMWGDIDGNGWLDLVAVNGAWGAGYDVVYLNWGGNISTTANWTNGNSDHSAGMDLGDYDNDGDLDLVTANYNGRECIYENIDGMFTTTPVWESYLNDDGTQDAVFLDVDGDDDLDLYFGCSATMDSLDSNADAMYFNDPGLWGDRRYGIYPDWSANNELWTTTVKAGDIDGDGNPDIIAANGYNNNNIVVMYENTGSTLDRDYSWNIEVNWPYSCALGDVDQDGWLDVAIASYNEKVYLVRNDEGVLEDSFVWEGSDTRKSYRCDWGDMNNDTFPDLAVANYNTTSTPGNNVVYKSRIELPEVFIETPYEGEVVAGNLLISGTAVGTAEFDLERVEFSLDEGENWVEGYGTEEWQYWWYSFDWEDGKYAIWARAMAGPLESEIVVVNVTLDNPENRVPTIEFISPPEGGGDADSEYTIEWNVQDEDADPVRIDLYFDTDSDAGNGREFIASVEADDGEYLWDTREIEEGKYFVCIVADDRNGSIVELYSEGTVTIEHADPANHDPVIEIVSFEVRADDYLEFRWNATDFDEDELLIDLYYDNDQDFSNGAEEIASGLENTGFFELDMWDISTGSYYFAFVAKDPQGGSAIAFSELYHLVEQIDLPEFWVVNLNILPDRAEFRSGDVVTIQAVVTNTGSAYWEGNVSLIVDNDTVETRLMKPKPGRETTIVFTWTAVEGNHNITVMVDYLELSPYQPHTLSEWVSVSSAQPVEGKDGDDDILTPELLAGSVIVIVVILVLLVVTRRENIEEIRCPQCGDGTTYYREQDDHYCAGCEEYVGDMR